MQKTRIGVVKMRYYIELFWPREPEASGRDFALWYHSGKKKRAQEIQVGDRFLLYETGSHPDNLNWKGAKKLFASVTASDELIQLPIDSVTEVGKRRWNLKIPIKIYVKLEREHGIELDRVREILGWNKGSSLRSGPIEIGKEAFLRLESELRANYNDRDMLKFKVGKYCRICWNTSSWKKPTGEAAEIEAGSDVEELGFGLEEWLFNFGWMINGYHYSYLQPIAKYFSKYTGKCLNIVLYTYSPKGPFFIGKIKNCHVISREDAQKALNTYHSKGWIKEMVSQLERLNIDSENIKFVKDPEDPTVLFNIKFKRDDLTFFDPFIQIHKGHKTRLITRYQPLDIEKDFRISKTKKVTCIRKTTKRKSEKTRYRKAQLGVEYDPHHDKLQNALFTFLKKKYGDRVLYETNFVDIQVVLDNEVSYYEVKIENNAKCCIRSALGQLLEYSCYPDKCMAKKLIVVGEHYATSDDKQYLEHIRSKFKIPLFYYYFDSDKKDIVQEI